MAPWRLVVVWSCARTSTFHTVPVNISTAEDDRWSVSLSGRNLLDENYLVAGIAQYNIGEIEGQVARPVEWALSARVRF